MKKPFILCCITFIALAPVCFIQGKPAKEGKSAANESTITDLEKSAWEAYKNKQADAFKALMSKEYYGVYAEGVKTLDGELADMAKSDLRDYSFSDVKVVFPHLKMAVMTTRRRCRRPLTARTYPARTTAEVFGFNRAENGSAPFILKPRRSRFSGQRSDVGSQASGSRLMLAVKVVRYENCTRTHVTRSFSGIADSISYFDSAICPHDESRCHSRVRRSGGSEI